MILFTLENGTPALNKISAYQSWAWCFQGLGCGLGIQENHSHPQTWLLNPQNWTVATALGCLLSYRGIE